MRPAELLDGAKLIDACPDTRFILDHCGNANVQAKDRTQWQRDIGAVAKRKNVVCKVSGIVVTAKPGAWSADDLAPIVNHTLEVFGPDRVMFGGDMVLQQGIKVPVWGTADDGEKVTVTLQGQEQATTAKDGKWLVRFDDLKVGGPYEMTIAGNNKVELKNVLVGEVWVCSGQS